MLPFFIELIIFDKRKIIHSGFRFVESYGGDLRNDMINFPVLGLDHPEKII